MKQLVIKPWDGFCGPLEVRTHPLPPPDSDCVIQWFRVLGASFWRFRGLRFRVLSASFSSFGCFVFEIWVLRASVFVFECFVFETEVVHPVDPEPLLNPALLDVLDYERRSSYRPKSKRDELCS